MIDVEPCIFLKRNLVLRKKKENTLPIYQNIVLRNYLILYLREYKGYNLLRETQSGTKGIRSYITENGKTLAIKVTRFNL